MGIRETLLISGCLCLPVPAEASPVAGRTGDAVLKMCQGAEKVKALSVMCHNYLNGFLDASAYAGRHGSKSTRFCLGEGDKERIPVTLVSWMGSHPDALKQEAGEALQRMLVDSFPCGKKR